ncbi:MAG: dihydrofolate reductase [Bacteroidetes bacterium]|nr:dihydrofolate reductase [Bacteroidota bacterium]
MTIAAIVATDLNNAIGKGNKLLWNLPADLKFFKATTMGCPIIMGRKTYESIGRILPGRRNIIISRNPDYKVTGALVFTTAEEAIKSCSEETVFVIGGAEIFKLTLPFTNIIYRTLVKASFDADVFIPTINENEFKMTWEECNPSDDKNMFDYCFQKWERIKN